MPARIGLFFFIQLVTGLSLSFSKSTAPARPSLENASESSSTNPITFSTIGMRAAKPLFLRILILSERVSIAVDCSSTRPVPSPSSPLKFSRSKLPERIADDMRCAPSAPKASVAIDRPSTSEVAFLIRATVSSSAVFGSPPMSAIVRLNLFRPGAIRVTSTPPWASCPISAVVSSSEKPMLAKTGPNVFTFDSRSSIGRPVA